MRSLCHTCLLLPWILHSPTHFLEEGGGLLPWTWPYVSWVYIVYHSALPSYPCKCIQCFKLRTGWKERLLWRRSFVQLSGETQRRVPGTNTWDLSLNPNTATANSISSPRCQQPRLCKYWFLSLYRDSNTPREIKTLWRKTNGCRNAYWKKKTKLHGDQLKSRKRSTLNIWIVSGIQQQQFELLLHH